MDMVNQNADCFTYGLNLSHGLILKHGKTLFSVQESKGDRFVDAS
jgi:hypothetical protein